MKPTYDAIPTQRRGLDGSRIARIVLYAAATLCFAWPFVSGDISHPRNRAPIYAGLLLVALPKWLGWTDKEPHRRRRRRAPRMRAGRPAATSPK